jgi:RNA recognition motif-containing protein
LPRHPDYKQKGHAFIVVDTEGLAEHIVSALNGVKFQGRSLGAKFAKEGVEPVGGYNNNESEPQYYNSQPQLASPFMLQDPQSAFSGESGEERAPLAQKEKIDRAKKSEKESSRSRDKEKKQPLVADGSGGRRRRR